jgi:hypothetical protein
MALQSYTVLLMAAMSELKGISEQTFLKKAFMSEQTNIDFEGTKIKQNACLDLARLVKAAIGESIRVSGLSREQVVDEMNKLIELNGIGVKKIPISKSLLEKWIAPSSIHEMPPKYWPIFAATVNSYAHYRAQLEALGLQVIGGDEISIYEYGKNEVQRLRHNNRKRELEKILNL